MAMNEDGSEQPNTDDGGDAVECGSGCDCNTPGLGTRRKVVVCLVVGLAAAVVVGRGFMKKAETENDGNQESFATVLPAVLADPATSGSKAAEIAEKEEGSVTLWGSPLESLASLNKVASEKDAVFVLVPAGNDEELAAIEKQIEAAANKIVSQGRSMAAFTLDKNAKDYTQITSQMPTPCVFAMVKGGGMIVVSKDITEVNLLQAVVAASRPSSCGPEDAGCGPSSCP